MRRFLAFRLYGPLASWGEIAVGEIRGSAARPTRSALLGLLGAALGLDRRDDEAHRRLASSVRLAVRTDAAGLPIVDYHTVQWRKLKRGQRADTRADILGVPRCELSTVQSWRHFRCDALYTVVAWTPAEATAAIALEELEEAIDRPRYPLSLGRKACPPALPLGPRLVEATDLRSALAAYDREASPLPKGLLHGRFRPDEVELAWEPGAGGPAPGDAPAVHVQRRDEPLSRKRWRFANRLEAVARLPARKEKEGSDAAESTDAP